MLKSVLTSCQAGERPRSCYNNLIYFLKTKTSDNKNQREHRARGLPVSPNGEDKHHERDFRYPQPIKWQSVQRNTLGVKNPTTSLCQPLISALQAVEPAEGPRWFTEHLWGEQCYSGSEFWLGKGGDAHPFVFKKLPSLTWVINSLFLRQWPCWDVGTGRQSWHKQSVFVWGSLPKRMKWKEITRAIN